MADARKGADLLDIELSKKPRLESPRVHSAAVQDLWEHGLPPGESTGWPSLDKHYTVLPGQMTVVTGWPASGKSEFVDALLLNLARKAWHFAIFSFENQPVSFHITKMLEKIAGKPFGKRGSMERIGLGELDSLTKELAEAFAFTGCTSGNFSLKDVLKAAGEFLSKYPPPKRGLVIDPWNELEHQRPPGITETEYISSSLSMVRNWARLNQVHVWIVAHPQKVRREEGKLPVPRPDMISGSQHWWNKADNAVTVWRDSEKPDSSEVDIHIQKVRFKHIGHPGLVTLNYERPTGRYLDKVGDF